MEPVRNGRTLRLAVFNQTDVMFKPEGYIMRKRPKKNRTFGYKVRDWITDKMWSQLHKWKKLEPYFFHEKVYSYGEEQAQEISKLLDGEIWRLFDERNMNEPEDYCIVVGGQEFYDIAKGYAHNGGQVLTLPSAEFRYAHAGGYKGRALCFPIHVVPWLTGAAIIPKAIVERLPKPHERPLF